MKHTYSVEGMTCSGCATSVQKAVEALSPSAKVSVNLEAKEVSVEGIDDEAAVAQAVEDAGFDFAGPAGG